ncbi:hypothetical protein BKA66DRAFT_573534 [Pyrenochaeta sp. MPI-SDFR-AT-0127]|nr:hypothetical protein BKA66DRAFT_573534 [Pyrenochaeta sp. MPI-SDFR-AT-0127]
MVTTRGVSREHVSKLVSPVTGSGFTAVESQLPQHERAPISTSLLRLHNQDLVDVMFEIEKCENPCAQSIFNLALGGHIHSLDESALKELRKERIGIFKPSEWDSPILAGMEQFPFASVPPVAQIQSIVTYDMEDQNSFRFAPSRGSPEQDTHAAVKLLNNIGNSVYCEPGAIIHMQSPTLDLLRSSSPNWHTDGFLGQSNFQVTIAPANEVFELEYYEHYFLSTLLVGSKVWLAFPPLHGNLTILRQAYEDMQTKDSIQVSLHFLKILQHGIAIIQKTWGDHHDSTVLVNYGILQRDVNIV